MQCTIQKDIVIDGIGLHTGRAVHMRLRPAPADHGIVFVRTDVSSADNRIPALWNRVVDTRLCTVIGNDSGITVGTIEHLMAAFAGCGIDNVLVEIDAREVPVMDGSSSPFVRAIDAAGICTLDSPRRAIRILKEIVVKDGNKEVRLSPSALPVYAGRIDYAHPDIGTQSYTLPLINGNFRHDVSDCRTFGFEKDVAAMRAAGLALGGSLDNAIVLDDSGVLNPGGLRCADEFVRHKVLDAVGDIFLAGGPVIGAYNGVRAGHAMNNAVLHALFADDGAWMAQDLYVDIAEPGLWAVPAGLPTTLPAA